MTIVLLDNNTTKAAMNETKKSNIQKKKPYRAFSQNYHNA